MITSHYNPVRVIWSKSAAVLPQRRFLERPLVVCSRGGLERFGEAYVRSLIGHEPVAYIDSVTANPTVEDIELLAKKVSGYEVSSVVAIGGGSVIDTAKCIAFFLPQKSDKDFRSFQSSPANWYKASLPLIAVPTTAGSGSEVTNFATIWDRTSQVKRSLENEMLFPNIAFLDPSLLRSQSDEQFMISGLDTMAHALESLWNRNRTASTRANAIAALDLANNSLLDLVLGSRSWQAIEKMQDASCLAGMAISCTHTALSHALSYPLTLSWGIPHGLAASFTLPAIWDYTEHTIELRPLELDVVTQAIRIVKELNPAKWILSRVEPNEIARLCVEGFDISRATNFVNSCDRQSLLRIVEMSLV